MKKIDVAILGATGAVGQRFIQLLENHPWFQIAELVGKSSAGKKYKDAVNWILDTSPPANILDMVVKPLDSELNSPIVFSALPKEAAITREIELASAGHVVCTNASAHRMADDVPLLLPEVNAEHILMIDEQRRQRGWVTGALVANSNCTTMPIVMALKPLIDFDIQKISMVSQQAVSGAGYPGVASLDIIDNVVPYVSGDEDKMQTETLKMLGDYKEGEFVFYQAKTSATCTRVPIIDGHLITISIELAQSTSLQEIIHSWQNFAPSEDILNLPSAPNKPVHYFHEQNRPQPRRDRMIGAGMTTSIGRLRECPVLGYKFIALAHNTIRGAAGCSILNAELLVRRGYVDGFSV